MSIVLGLDIHRAQITTTNSIKAVARSAVAASSLPPGRPSAPGLAAPKDMRLRPPWRRPRVGCSSVRSSSGPALAPISPTQPSCAPNGEKAMGEDRPARCPPAPRAACSRRSSRGVDSPRPHPGAAHARAPAQDARRRAASLAAAHPGRPLPARLPARGEDPLRWGTAPARRPLPAGGRPRSRRTRPADDRALRARTRTTRARVTLVGPPPAWLSGAARPARNRRALGRSAKTEPLLSQLWIPQSRLCRRIPIRAPR